jgi:hypothetical protein
LEKSPYPAAWPEPNKLTAEAVWNYDIRVMAAWVRDGARALWETDPEELRQTLGPMLRTWTEGWPRGDGLTRERWQWWEYYMRRLLDD